MKKILILLLLVMLTSTLKAQTKEETISWLKDKLENCLTSNVLPVTDIKVLSIDECEFKVSYTLYGLGYVMTVPTANISKKLLKDSYDGEISFDKDVVKYIISSPNQVDDIKYRNYSYLCIGNTEENIRKNMFKAFARLATFCTVKKTETN